MKLEKRLTIVKGKLTDIFLSNVNLDIIKFVCDGVRLICIDIGYRKIENKDEIILKCVYKKGFVGRKRHQYVFLHPFEIKSDDVFISEDLNYKYFKMMDDVNGNEKLNGKSYKQIYIQKYIFNNFSM